MSAKRLTPYQLERLERIAYAGPLRVTPADTATTIGASGLRAITRRGLVERTGTRGSWVKITDKGVSVLADAATQLELTDGA